MKTGKYVVNQVNILYQVQVAGKYGFKLGDCCANNPNVEMRQCRPSSKSSWAPRV